MLALSATLTTPMLGKTLGMFNVAHFKMSPDKPNIFLDLRKKPSNMDIIECSEFVYVQELKMLKELQCDYPVTLCYMPLDWMSDAQALAAWMFGPPNLQTTHYALLFSEQDKDVVHHVTHELKKDSPTVRLVFCSASVGMGFDGGSITRIIHAKPPRNMLDFVQQIGRAGRVGQESISIMYYNNNDIAKNVKGLTDDIRKYVQSECCLRLEMLSVFGFDEPSEILTGCKCCLNCKIKCKCANCSTGEHPEVSNDESDADVEDIFADCH